jgi:hypothetical protein
MIHALYGTRAGAKQIRDTDRAARPGSLWPGLMKNEWTTHQDWFHEAGEPFRPHLHNPFGHRIESILPNGKLKLAVMDLDGYTECLKTKELDWWTKDFCETMSKMVDDTGAEINIYAGGFGTPTFKRLKKNISDSDKPWSESSQWFQHFIDNTANIFGFADAVFFDALSTHNAGSLEMSQVQAMEAHPLNRGKIGGEATPRKGQEDAWKKLNILLTTVGWFKWLYPMADDSVRRVGINFTDINNRRYYILALNNVRRNLKFFQRRIRDGYHVIFPLQWAIDQKVSYTDMIDGSMLDNFE